MTTMLETAPALEQLTPRSEQVAARILTNAEPLRSDPDVIQEFYGPGGIVPTETQSGTPLSGHAVLYADERRQSSGSYKRRGAEYATMKTPPGSTLVTYSTGNQGISLGHAGAIRDRRVIIEATKSINSIKYGLATASGAEVNAVHDTFIEAQHAAEARDGILIGPFGHPDTLAGQCSLGFELVESIVTSGLADKRVVIPVAVAGGGHISGIALPIWQAKQEGRLGPNVTVVGVQPSGNNTLGRAVTRIQRGQDTTNLYVRGEKQDKLCDALVITEESLSPDTLAITADTNFVSGFVTMDRLSIARAVKRLEAELGGTVETAAALPYAYAEAYAVQHPAQEGEEAITFILPISGGNMSPEIAEECDVIIEKADKEAARLANAQRAWRAFMDLSTAHIEKNHPRVREVNDYAVPAIGSVATDQSVNNTTPRTAQSRRGAVWSGPQF